MRLWTLHPRYLDTRGLVAAWREALLAQAVLLGRTRGYTKHPQLARFLAAPSPRAAMAAYLRGIQHEGARRGFRLDAARIALAPAAVPCKATRGQLAWEWAHLMEKLRTRDPERFARQSSLRHPRAHPLFRMIAGEVEPWEKGPPFVNPV